MNDHPHEAKLVAQLDALERKLDDLLEQYPDEADFWSAFAGETEGIIEDVDAHDSAYAQGRIDCMLKNAGLIPGEDEGEPCA